MTTNAELLARRQAAVPRGVNTAHPVFAVRASNAEIWDVEGKRYIDFVGGIGVQNTGHRHPKVVKAIETALQGTIHTAFQVSAYESYIALAERLNAAAPIEGPAKTIFFSTGAEAVENATKIARYATKRSAVIAFSGAFHGRTLFTMAMTGKVVPYKAGFGDMPGGIHRLPFPIESHGHTAAQSLEALEMLFKTDVEPSRVAAIIIEPVQGEGGFYPAPPAFLRALRELCDRHGIVLIADEIQSGFARTGRMFAIEHAGVVPDLITVAKSLAGGVPLSGVIGRADIMDAPPAGGLGGTYAGSPLGCAAGLAVLDVIESEDLCARAERQGTVLRARLEDLRSRWSCIGDVRGLGAMVAMELVHDRRADAPDAELTRALVQAAGRRGLVLLSCGVHGNVIRFLAPLTMPDAELAEGLAILEAALEDVAGAR
ncbi:MAG: 4-aminobutyrate--2-oxoglutarate transaminase [Gammaproteobacteria bacterium]